MTWFFKSLKETLQNRERYIVRKQNATESTTETKTIRDLHFFLDAQYRFIKKIKRKRKMSKTISI